jgi:hypothetical protein
MRFRLKAFVVSVCFMPGVLVAQEPGAETKVLNVFQVDTPPVIDGVLDDASWAMAEPVEDLHQIWPTEYAPPSQETVVYVIYDENAVYIGARLSDSDPEQITAQVLRQGERPANDDYFAVIISPFNDQRSGYLFEVNPNGVRSEAQYQDGRREQYEWQGIWNAASTLDDGGWTTEIEIPLKSLSFDAESDTWGINFRRRIGRSRQADGWVSRNRSQNPVVSGRAVGFSGLQQGVGLDVVPQITMTERKEYVSASASSDFVPSLDVFYKFTPELTGVVTLNTDFSATEVDDRQVNLTRFSLFFPEKRDFFLQDSDIFEFGRIGGGMGANSHNGRPFFSRTIGLNDNREPVDLTGGVKLSGRVGPWSLGVLGVRQDESGTVGASDIFVGRAAMNVLAESSVGMIFTDGDPKSDLDNSVVGFDFRYQNSRLASGRTFEAETWYQKSETPGLEDNDEAFGFGVRHNSFDGFGGFFEFREIQENFNPALGFVNRSGIRRLNGNVTYYYRPRDSALRAYHARLGFSRFERLSDGQIQSDFMFLRFLEVQNHVGDRISMTYRPQRENLFEPFEITDGVVIPVGDYDWDAYRVEMRTGPQRRLAANMQVDFGDFYGGERLGVSPTITWRPSRHFLFDLSYQLNEVDLPEGSFTTRLTRLRADFVFSSRLSWVNVLQWDNDSNALGLNSRLHWIPRAGQEAFFVLNHSLQDIDLNRNFRSEAADVTLKFIYTFRY